jgi:hypothetical protein
LLSKTPSIEKERRNFYKSILIPKPNAANFSYCETKSIYVVIKISLGVKQLLV